MGATVKELRDALLVLDTKTAYADYCEKRYDADPDDTVAEAVFDNAYKEEHEAFRKAKDVLCKLIGCDGRTANEMLRKHRTEIDRIIERWVGNRRGSYSDLREILKGR